jgi:hypothetical protein
MARPGPRPCSLGTCGPDVLACWHTGERVPYESTALYALNSWAQWAWKIAEELAPAPVTSRMRRRRKAKSKRIRREEKARLRR